MEFKKTPKTDLKNKKILFFEIGLSLSLLIVLYVFSWTSREKTTDTLRAEHQKIEEEQQVPITHVEKNAQVVDEVDEVIPFAILEDEPMFQGKEAKEFVKWIYSKLEYPQQAVENNIQGTVRISFTVNVDGSLSDVKSLSNIDPLLEDCVIEIVKKSPKWTPGRYQSKPVNVTYQVPVVFKLQQ